MSRRMCCRVYLCRGKYWWNWYL